MRLTPLLLLVGALAGGEAVAFAFPAFALGLWWWALGLSGLIVLLGYGWRTPGWGLAATALLGFAVAGSHLSSRQHVLDTADLNYGPFVCEATLGTTPGVHGAWFSADISVAELDLRVIFPKGVDTPQAGDVWRFAGWLERKPATDFSRRKLWVKGRGTEARRVQRATAWTPAVVLERVRHNFSRRLGLGLAHAPGVANLNRAILLGERRGIDFETRDVFAAAGTTHIFAISGLHVMCVAGLLVAVVILCGVPVRLGALIVVPVLWGYVLLVGAAPSAVRAAAMATLCLAAPLFWRSADGLAAWALVFLVVHLFRPFQLVQVGSCLSFAVMLTLILVSRWYREVVPSRRGEVFVISFAAWAAGVPIVAVVFGRFTPGAVLANLVLLPLAFVSVLMGALAVAASFLSVTAAIYLNNAAALATSVMVGVSRVIAAVPGAAAEVAPWTFSQCAAWYLVLVLTFYLIRSIALRRRKHI